MLKRIFAILAMLILLFGAYMGFRSGYKTNRSSSNSSSTSSNSSASNSGAASSVPASTNEVIINNFAFSPADLTVDKGTKVTFKNEDSTVHTVTADDGTFDTKNINPGSGATLTFKQSGTYNYHCSIHNQMKGTVIVK